MFVLLTQRAQWYIAEIKPTLSGGVTGYFPEVCDPTSALQGQYALWCPDEPDSPSPSTNLDAIIKTLRLDGTGGFYFANGPIPTQIGMATMLQQLLLKYSSQTIPNIIPSEIALLSSLERFEIESIPGAGGTLPSELGLLPYNTGVFRSFRIRNAGIIGTIPTELALLSDKGVSFGLTALQLTGTIPSEFENTIFQAFELQQNLLVTPVRNIIAPQCRLAACVDEILVPPPPPPSITLLPNNMRRNCFSNCGGLSNMSSLAPNCTQFTFTSCTPIEYDACYGPNLHAVCLPTVSPTPAPSPQPSVSPSESPTLAPSHAPTLRPTPSMMLKTNDTDTGKNAKDAAAEELFDTIVVPVLIGVGICVLVVVLLSIFGGVTCWKKHNKRKDKPELSDRVLEKSSFKRSSMRSGHNSRRKSNHFATETRPRRAGSGSNNDIGSGEDPYSDVHFDATYFESGARLPAVYESVNIPSTNPGYEGINSPIGANYSSTPLSVDSNTMDIDYDVAQEYDKVRLASTNSGYINVSPDSPPGPNFQNYVDLPSSTRERGSGYSDLNSSIVHTHYLTGLPQRATPPGPSYSELNPSFMQSNFRKASFGSGRGKERRNSMSNKNSSGKSRKNSLGGSGIQIRHSNARLPSPRASPRGGDYATDINFKRDVKPRKSSK